MNFNIEAFPNLNSKLNSELIYCLEYSIDEFYDYISLRFGLVFPKFCVAIDSNAEFRKHKSIRFSNNKI